MSEMEKIYFIALAILIIILIIIMYSASTRTILRKANDDRFNSRYNHFPPPYTQSPYFDDERFYPAREESSFFSYGTWLAIISIIIALFIYSKDYVIGDDVQNVTNQALNINERQKVLSATKDIANEIIGLKFQLSQTTDSLSIKQINAKIENIELLVGKINAEVEQ